MNMIPSKLIFIVLTIAVTVGNAGVNRSKGSNTVSNRRSKTKPLSSESTFQSVNQRMNTNVPSSPSTSSSSVNQYENVDDDLMSPPTSHSWLSDQNEGHFFDLNILPPELAPSDGQSDNINYSTPFKHSPINNISPELRESSPTFSSTTPGYQKTVHKFDLNQHPRVEGSKSKSY